MVVMTDFEYSSVCSVLLLVGFVVIVSREWIVGFCIHLLISFFSLDSSGFRGGLPLVALKETRVLEQPPLSPTRLGPSGLQTGFGNRQFVACLPRIPWLLVYSSVFHLRVCLRLSSREPSTHVRSVYHVGRRRVVCVGQDKLRRGI